MLIPGSADQQLTEINFQSGFQTPAAFSGARVAQGLGKLTIPPQKKILEKIVSLFVMVQWSTPNH